MSDLQIWMLICLPIPLAKIVQALSDWIDIVIEQPCLNLVIFPIGLRSELWMGHFKTFKFLFFNHSSVAFWVTVLLEGGPPLQSEVSCRLEQDFFFLPRIALYLIPSFLPTILTTFPGPVIEKHHQNMTLPPPCFDVRIRVCFAEFRPNTELCAKAKILGLLRTKNSFPIYLSCLAIHQHFGMFCVDLWLNNPK